MIECRNCNCGELPSKYPGVEGEKCPCCNGNYWACPVCTEEKQYLDELRESNKSKMGGVK